MASFLSNLPKTHKYYIRVHGNERFIYVENQDGKKEMFELTPEYDEIFYHKHAKDSKRDMESNYLYRWNFDGMLTHILCIIDSNDENLWFGTYNGISIYDGQDIKNFTII